MIRNNKTISSYCSIISRKYHSTYFLKGFHSNFEGGEGPLSKISTFDTHTVLSVTITMFCESFKSISQLLKEEIRCEALAS